MVLQFLVNLPGFDFETYVFKEDWIFLPCPPGHQLLIRKEHIPSQYVLKTAHIEEASYEGNVCVLCEWWRQLECSTLDRQREMGKSQTIV